MVNDPWEEYNRSIYSFNNGFDKAIARPLAKTYEKITSESVQNCVSSFFGNLREPGTAVNQTLQGEPLNSLRTIGRFVINTTVGIAGLYDPASYFGISKGYEDFGQTLAVWGWQDSRYLVVPLLGPRTVRDTASIVGDQPLSAIGYVENGSVMLGLNIMQLTDARTRALPFDEIRSQSIDEYVMVRDAWMKKRATQITKD
ncbi:MULTISPECIES: MlaA family lipoprotein [Methylotenera]|uniref:MlaA family lipoprotein n=1 Tax=Methylotenera TaxID=359407 RepID=UPI0009DAC17B|nr:MULTISPECIES: VacJ family lipoprotein [Methylotenera]